MDNVETTNSAATVSSTNVQEVPVTKSKRAPNRSKEIVAAEKALIAQKRAAEEAKRAAKGHKKPGPKAASVPKLARSPKRSASELTLTDEQVENASESRDSEDRLIELSGFINALGTPDEALAILNSAFASMALSRWLA
jgi:hypothetical protein